MQTRLAQILLAFTLAVSAASCAHPQQTAAVESPATAESEAVTFVDEFLAIMERHSMFASGTGWERIKQRARQRALSSTDALSTYPILEEVINAVGDEHGGLNVSEERTAEYQRRYGGLWYELTSRQPASDFMNRETPVVEDVALPGGSVRVLIVPRVFTNEDEQAYARALFAATAQAPGVCGFVLDLRGIIGGDMWPMLAGLSPLLGDGQVGAFTSRTEPIAWTLEQGRARASDAESDSGFTLASWTSPPRELATAPVALLLDDGVLSSGEAVAVAFSGRPNARSFGMKTYGLSTANTPFDLSDGSTLYIATGVYRDRLGKDFPHGVSPDVEVDPAGDRSPALGAALEWLSHQGRCQRA